MRCRSRNHFPKANPSLLTFWQCLLRKFFHHDIYIQGGGVLKVLSFVIRLCDCSSVIEFYLISAPPRLQLILYTDEEVWAALEPLRAIPTYTEVLTIDPPEPPKRKPAGPAEDPPPKPASDMMTESEREVKPEPVDTAGAKPKIPARKPKGSPKQVKPTVKLLGKPPRPRPTPTAASL